MPELLDAALDYAVHGWPVMPVKPHGKEPASSHGVKDATTDERTILNWWERWPDANIGIACGAPGPTVLDVDRPNIARPVLEKLKTEPDQPPTAATARGRHLYFNGEPRGTGQFDWGELRGRGSYVIAPPSTHPSGKDYVWLLAPTGPAAEGPRAADPEQGHDRGDWGIYAPEDLVKHGQRHDFLKDIAVRAVRDGITDVPTMMMILMAAYETHCVKRPKAKPDEFQKLAEWAAGTDIADRERTETAEADQGLCARAQRHPRRTPPVPRQRRRLGPARRHRSRRPQGRPRSSTASRSTSPTASRSGSPARTTSPPADTGNGPSSAIPTASPTRRHSRNPSSSKVYRSLCVLADTPAEDRENRRSSRTPSATSSASPNRSPTTTSATPAAATTRSPAAAPATRSTPPHRQPPRPDRRPATAPLHPRRRARRATCTTSTSTSATSRSPGRLVGLGLERIGSTAAKRPRHDDRPTGQEPNDHLPDSP